MPKAGKTVLGRQHRVKRLEGPATPGSEVVKAGVAQQATPAPRTGGKKKAATTVRMQPTPALMPLVVCARSADTLRTCRRRW
jgi:hypothetical protein